MKCIEMLNAPYQSCIYNVGRRAPLSQGDEVPHGWKRGSAKKALSAKVTLRCRSFVTFFERSVSSTSSSLSDSIRGTAFLCFLASWAMGISSSDESWALQRAEVRAAAVQEGKQKHFRYTPPTNRERAVVSTRQMCSRIHVRLLCQSIHSTSTDSRTRT